MPVLALMGHLALVDPDGLATGVAILSKHAVKAGEAVRPAISHDVPLPTQLQVAFKAGKVLHVPGTTFSLSALIGEDDLIARRASGLDGFSVVPATVEFSLLVEVDEVHQKFFAD